MVDSLNEMKTRIQAIIAQNKRDEVRKKIGQYLLLILLILFVVEEFKVILQPRTITFINNIEVKEVEKISVVEPKKQIEPNIEEIVYKIYRLESSAGINDSCKAEGKFNGYGYAIYKGSYRCFESHEQVTEIVSDWVIEKLKTHSLPETLCGYNLGFQSEHLQECINQSDEHPYYKRFLNL